MRDTEKRERRPIPDAPESLSPAEPMSAAPRSTVDPMSTVEPEPIPVDEAGLERGGPVRDAPMIDETADGSMADGSTADRPMTDTPGSDWSSTGTPLAGKPMTDKPTTDRSAAGETLTDEPMFADDVADRLRTRWRELQADFVDDPERAVRAADDVVDEMMKTIAERRQRLTGEWQGHTDTEELRLALRGYRSFFDTLLPH
jgi:hypothetical protein